MKIAPKIISSNNCNDLFTATKAANRLERTTDHLRILNRGELHEIHETENNTVDGASTELKLKHTAGGSVARTDSAVLHARRSCGATSCMNASESWLPLIMFAVYLRIACDCVLCSGRAASKTLEQRNRISLCSDQMVFFANSIEHKIRVSIASSGWITASETRMLTPILRHYRFLHCQ